MSGDEQLKEAAFVQKYQLLNDKRLRVIFPFKLLLGHLAALVLLSGMLFLNGRNLGVLYRNMAAYDKIDDPKRGYPHWKNEHENAKPSHIRPGNRQYLSGLPLSIRYKKAGLPLPDSR